MRAAHVVKGAASNLMCYDLRDTSSVLEVTAKHAHQGDVTSNPMIVQQQCADMKTAFDQLNQFLHSIGV